MLNLKTCFKTRRVLGYIMNRLIVTQKFLYFIDINNAINFFLFNAIKDLIQNKSFFPNLSRLPICIFTKLVIIIYFMFKSCLFIYLKNLHANKYNDPSKDLNWCAKDKYIQ